MAVELLGSLVGDLDVNRNQPITNLSDDIHLYTDMFTVTDANTLLGKTFGSVAGELGVTKTRLFARNFITGTNLEGSLGIRKRLFSNVQGQVELRENTPVMSSVKGLLDIYDGTQPPTLRRVYAPDFDQSTGIRQTGVQVYFNGVDISGKLTRAKVNYSISKYVGELNLTFTDWEMYSDLNPLDHWATMVFRVYADGQFVGDFFMEKRTSKANFKSTSLSVWGRSKPALLSTPFCIPVDTAWNEATTALSIVTEVMEGYDVTLDWRIMDYDILGGKVTSDNRTPVEIVSDLASPIAGMLYTNFAGDLIVDYPWVELDLG